MSDIVETLPKVSKSFAKDVFKMASAPITTQIIGILVMPILVRMYSPSDFGIAQLFGSLTTPLSVFVTFGYSVPILLELKDENSKTLLQLNLLIAFCYSLLITCSIYLFRNEVIEYFHRFVKQIFF